MMRRRRLWRALLGILATALILLVVAAWPGCSTYTVGTETTYVTGPLDKHGYVDYVAALNERLSKGVTPENNANVLIWQALGPRPEGAPMHSEYFERLGIEPPPEQGDYFVSWSKHLREQEGLGVKVQRDPNNPNALTLPERPWTAKDIPELAGWLKRNEKPLAVAMAATRRREYFNPLVPERTENWSAGLLHSLVPTVHRSRDLADAIVSRAMLRLAEGRIEEAWQDLLACHRLGRMVARGGSLIELLAGFHAESMASSHDVVFLDRAKLTSKQVLACWENWRKLAPMPALADKIDLGERFIMLDTISLMARLGTAWLDLEPCSTPPKDTSFTSRLFTRSINWDPALRNANLFHDRCAAILHIIERPRREQEMAELTQRVLSLKLKAAGIDSIQNLMMGSERRGAMMGNVLTSLMLPAFNKVHDAGDRGDQVRRNLTVAFALAAYQRNKGRYPAKLEELVPRHLKTVPADLFSDKPLIYRLEGKGYLLYSVGLNGIDEDGRSYGDVPPGDDLSVRIPVPEPRVKN
jgi:hypothetical protein